MMNSSHDVLGNRSRFLQKYSNVESPFVSRSSKATFHTSPDQAPREVLDSFARSTFRTEIMNRMQPLIL